MKWVGTFQVGNFWVGIFWKEIFPGGVWWVGTFRMEIFLESYKRLLSLKPSLEIFIIINTIAAKFLLSSHFTLKKVNVKAFL